jgi:hypothetical protein
LNPYSNSSNSADPVAELSTYLLYTPGTDIVLYPDQTVSSPLGPIANALESWEIIPWIATMTDDQDALAIAKIKSSMNLTDWTGDPCVPVPHAWVTCTLDNNSVPLITAVNLAAYNLTGDISWGFGNLLNLIALNLSSNQLTGSIPPSIWHITTLNTLDLSKNSLSGNLITTSTTTPCPENLQYLNLAGNNFSGTFPAQLFFCSFYHLEQVNCDNNSFSGILDMDILVEKYTSYLSNVLISILYNNISGLIPNNGTYSPILLGGNPCCNPTSEALYYAPFYCRYNSVGVLIPNLG